jgi:hypothetical protein
LVLLVVLRAAAVVDDGDGTGLEGVAVEIGGVALVVVEAAVVGVDGVTATGGPPDGPHAMTPARRTSDGTNIARRDTSVGRPGPMWCYDGPLAARVKSKGPPGAWGACTDIHVYVRPFNPVTVIDAGYGTSWPWAQSGLQSFTVISPLACAVGAPQSDHRSAFTVIP